MFCPTFRLRPHPDARERQVSISSLRVKGYCLHGSVDIYFGPQGPKGKERNWIRTVPRKGWFTYLRFYSPTAAFFDQTWKPDDIAEMK